jgi:hypothetical protein
LILKVEGEWKSKIVGKVKQKKIINVNRFSDFKRVYRLGGKGRNSYGMRTEMVVCT